MQSTLNAVRGRGLHIRFKIKAQRGKPENAISVYAGRHRAGLIVISAGWGGRRGLARGSVARTLGRSAPCPVLVTPAAAPRAHHAVQDAFREVVCAVDFTKVSFSALEVAAAFAPHRGGRMTLVHAVGDTWRGMVFSGSEAARLARDQARHDAAASRRLLRLVPHAVLKRYRVRLVVASGRPYQLIADEASQIKADLIVMGMPRRSRLDEWMGGSTSRAVLGRARSPVLLVPA
jgi:nucleotide-binding universal stress UspA family protein